jgi:hypothetical protein
MTDWIIIASGHSAPGSLEGVDLTGRRVITVNSSWRLWPDADYHYSNDYDWWQHEAFEGRGVKLCGDPDHQMGHWRFVKRHRGLCMDPGKLAWGGNSGYAAINLAYHLGAKRIYLVGYDMCGKSHWHGHHAAVVKKDFNFKMWIQRFKELSRDLQRQKVCAINCSPISKLDCFQRGSLK